MLCQCQIFSVRPLGFLLRRVESALIPFIVQLYELVVAKFYNTFGVPFGLVVS
jgi:hypothetical protein